MSSIQVVFLFDLNACADFLFTPKEEFNRRLLSVRLACLRLLSNFSAKYPNMKWGAKFFDSQGSKNQSMCKLVFTDFSLENFETLENEICVRYERHLSILQALLESSNNNLSSVNNRMNEKYNIDVPIKILQLALTQVLCEFQWETMDMWSPSYTKAKRRKRNFLFVFSDFKDDDEMLHKYFGLNNSLSKPKFMNLFLPQTLRDSVVKKADIHLVILNMHEDQKFMGNFSSKILPLLCKILHSIQGSFIPLCILSQPLYDLKSSNGLERNVCQEKMLISNLPTGYQNSFISFSTLFEQSLHHPFYSTEDALHDCHIDFANRNVQIPIQIMEISNKNPNLCEDANVKTTCSSSMKSECADNTKYVWSKFSVHSTVPRCAHFPATTVILCLPGSHDSNSHTCGLQKLNETLSIEGFNLLLDCLTEDGKNLPGLLTSLSCDVAIISIFDFSANLKLGCELSNCNFSLSQELKKDFLDEIQNLCKKGLPDDVGINKLSSVIPKPFEMECLENPFKEKNLNLTSKTSNKFSKIKDYSNLLKLSVSNNKSSKSKQTKQASIPESKLNVTEKSKITEEKLPDAVPNDAVQMKYLEELPTDISHEELLSAIRDAYNSAIESSVNVVTASKTIIKIMVNYCKKQNETSYETNVNSMFKENFMMTGRRITEKYETLDSKEAAEKIIKECQIQILLNLEVESLKSNPDKLDCINTVTSLFKIAQFYFMLKETLQLDGLKENRIFLYDVLKKNYGDSLHDIVEACIEEFGDSKSSPGSPAETISSEFNNEEELFSSMISSTVSEKSSSSAGSCKINSKDAKDKNTLERKLIRRRSDISDTVRYRQVLLPKSSAKKKKTKAAANRAVRCSPRLAVKRNEHNKSAFEKTNKARRNLFSGDKGCRTPKKNDSQATPKSKKKNFASKTKFAAETPCHKQNYSVLQKRKSFIDCSSSPKVIDESPKIRKVAIDGANKELFEKYEKAKQSQGALKPSSTNVEQIPRPRSFNDCTPESKRRLSLKLFSKLLNSPTARQGIKKCTKRLFEQISPQKSGECCKKFKSSNESEDTSNLSAKNENLS